MTEVLLATYNGAKYLPPFLDSLLQQSDKDWRLVVRDDGSTDETTAVLQRYRKLFGNRMSIMEDGQKHLGSMRSFERLLAASQADYCLFADQDDIWLPDKIRHARERMLACEAETGADTPTIVYSDLMVTDEQLKVLGTFWQWVKLRPDLLRTPRQMAVNNYVTGCTMMMNRAAIKVSLPFGAHALVHDAVIGLAVCAAGGRIEDIGVADILYRQHGNNEVGAVHVRPGVAYVWQKLMHCGRVIRQQFANYRQARDIIPITPWGFLYNRCKYLLRR